MSASVAERGARADAVPRLLAGARTDGRPLSLGEHLERHGELELGHARRSQRELVELVEASGLRGRGGALFPTGRKLRAVAGARRTPIVLANGAEGEPVSAKDETLLACVPHLVLDGAAVAATAVGARDVVVAVGAPLAAATAEAAIAERRRVRERVRFRVVVVPDRFVAGEETALVSWVGGGPAKPTFTPPRPYERGLRGAPTLVLNVETLAQLALVARFGADWFRALGTAEEPGSALVTLAGAVRRPGVYEVPLGLPVADLLAGAGDASAPIEAFLFGGYFGAWVAAAEGEACALLESDLRFAGASLGARAIFALPESACGIVETARVARYLAEESAGQCGPCVHGLAAIASDLEDVAWGRGHPRAAASRLGRRLQAVSGRGACRHPDGAVRFVESALRVFAGELERHLSGRCRSGGRGGLLPLGRRRAAA